MLHASLWSSSHSHPFCESLCWFGSFLPIIFTYSLSSLSCICIHVCPPFLFALSLIMSTQNGLDPMISLSLSASLCGIEGIYYTIYSVLVVLLMLLGRCPAEPASFAAHAPHTQFTQPQTANVCVCVVASSMCLCIYRIASGNNSHIVLIV